VLTEELCSCAWNNDKDQLKTHLEFLAKVKNGDAVLNNLNNRGMQERRRKGRGKKGRGKREEGRGGREEGGGRRKEEGKRVERKGKPQGA
jgi:hypothetical protein